jgi:hypothetical protein
LLVVVERWIFERCDKAAGRDLNLRAAVAGHGHTQER